MKRVISVILVLVLVLSCGLTSCQSAEKSSPIIVLFTNDTHCGISDDIGFSGIAAYKKYLQQTEKYVTLVDCGDAVQGEAIGAVTEGEAIINIMNAVGYDVCTFGNHEFDFGMDHLVELIAMAKAEYVCCNINYLGSGENKLAKIQPYKMMKYGSRKVAFVGVETPQLIATSTPVFYMEDGGFVYNFYNGEDGQLIFEQVQKTVDAAKKEGADYVILLTHCGDSEEEAPYRSIDIIEHTNGIDAVLDGHSHTEIPCTYVNNKDGKPICLSSTGTKIANIGQLVISPDGFISVSFIEDYSGRDEEIDQVIANEEEKFNEEMNVVMASSNLDLSITDANGIRMIRSREMPIGDLVADAWRAYRNTDIAFSNGGGIRASLAAGDITYGDIYNVSPFLTNCFTVAEIDGQTIADLLEYFYKEVQIEYVKDGKAYGEFGSFQQVSGIRFTVDTSVESSVVCDENNDLVSVGKTRRVSNIEVLQGDKYEPLDMNKTYTVASHDYMLVNGGSGTLNVSGAFNIIERTSIPMCMILKDYISNVLYGDLSQYQEVAGRITIK